MAEQNTNSEQGDAVTGWAVFQYRDFTLYVLARLFATLAFQMMGTAVGWQVYSITGDPLDLGFVGLVQFIPILLFGIIGGQTADQFERRNIMVVCLVLSLICSAGLAVLSTSELTDIWPILAVLAIFSIGRAFHAPASQAFMPNLVPFNVLPSAVGWNSSLWQIGTIGGPALAGLLLIFGTTLVYAATAALTALAVGLTILIKKRPLKNPSKRNLSWQELTLGLSYVWGNKPVLGAISLDLVAVLLGGVTALLPIFAADILGVGATGYGWLRAAPAIGAVMMALTIAQKPIRRNMGKAMFTGVGIYGLATLIFALSANYWLSLIMLIVAGCADMISVYVRQNLVQVATPDAMRGRVGAVNSVFITASNELGEFESGALAALIGVVPCVVVGAVGTLTVTLLWSRLFPALRAYDRPEDPLNA